MNALNYRLDAFRHMDEVGAQWQDIKNDFMAFLVAPYDVGNPRFGVTYADLRISTHPIVDETTYMTAMHETGHIVNGHVQRYNRCRRELHRVIVRWEAEAWAWAFEHAISPPSESAVEEAVLSFRSYLVPYHEWTEADLDVLPDAMKRHHTMSHIFGRMVAA